MAKILLVDDSRTLLQHIKGMLVAGGHDVIATSSGRTAVNHIVHNSVDLVLTDLYMPAPDGFEIVQTVRDSAQRPPLIVMSSNSLACGVYRDSRLLGAATALQKPFTAQLLLGTIDEVLKTHRGANAPSADSELREANTGTTRQPTLLSA